MLSDLQILANVLGGFSAFIALVLGVVAAVMARAQIIAAREASALDAFLDYMKAIIEHHAFDEPDMTAIENDASLYTQYRRFVGYALTACERVLLYSRGQSYWVETVKSHVRRHKQYVCSELFSRYLNHYAPAMRKILEEVRAEGGTSVSDPTKTPRS